MWVAIVNSPLYDLLFSRDECLGKHSLETENKLLKIYTFWPIAKYTQKPDETILTYRWQQTSSQHFL